MKKYIFFMLTFILAIGLCVTNKASAADDVTGNYHEEGLRYLILKGALTPDAKGNYNPNNTVTRAQFASYLSKVLEIENTKDPIKFKDVQTSSKYYQDIQNAATAGIITGYTDGTFDPNANITRQHMSVMLERALIYLGIPTETDITLTFKDLNQIYKPYHSAIKVGVKHGIIQGSTEKDGVYFYPSKNTPISQASTFILRMMQVAGDEDANNVAVYELKEISNNTLVAKGTYMSFKEALAAKTKSTQVITKSDEIVYMDPNSGYAVTNAYTPFYSETIKDSVGVQGGTEIQYLNSDGEKVKIDIAGQIGYVDVEKVTLIPTALSKGRSYYEKTAAGEIRHVLVNQSTGKASASYTLGKAPAEMTAGVKYYSWNGIDMTGGGKTFQYYNYYQFLPIHSKTQYTAAELNKYIDYILKEREPLGGVYANATTKSKLINIGDTLKQVEEKYKVNALMILSLAFNESTYGLSTQAQTNNNLFGLYVSDTDPKNEKFASVQANIEALLNDFWLKNYVPANKPYAHGAVFGAKGIGFNVKYASDPYWGAKAAGHYYQVEKYLGFKDTKTPYTIGITTTTNLAVRSEGRISADTLLYRHNRSNMPLIITNTALDGWYQIIPDNKIYSTGFVSKDYVKILNTTK